MFYSRLVDMAKTQLQREAEWRGEHPDFIEGAAVLVDQTAMDDLLRRLQHGDPTRGWEGDPRLVLAYHKPSQTWELHRAEGGGYSLVARSKPGMPFPGNIIDALVERDGRRGFDAKKYVDDHNAAQRKAEEAAQTAYNTQFAERLAWAVKKDSSTGAGI